VPYYCISNNKHHILMFLGQCSIGTRGPPDDLSQLSYILSLCLSLIVENPPNFKLPREFALRGIVHMHLLAVSLTLRQILALFLVTFRIHHPHSPTLPNSRSPTHPLRRILWAIPPSTYLPTSWVPESLEIFPTETESSCKLIPCSFHETTQQHF
jgi:hypothetical protein